MQRARGGESFRPGALCLLCLLCVACGKEQMMSVRFMFTDGFDNDTVAIRIDGAEVTRHGPITTRHDVEPALAWSVDVPVHADTVTAEVSVPSRQRTGSIRLDVKQFPQVNVSLAGNEVQMRASALVPSIG